MRSLAPRGSRAQALPVTDERTRARERLTTAFGWLSGGALGLLANFGVYRAVGDTYPVTISTFIVFVAGAFGGSWLADRFGARAFKPLGITAGLLLALLIMLVLASFLGAGSTP